MDSEQSKVIRVKFWTRESVEADPNTLYVFGDNDVKRGKKGQAVIRDLPNAFGIPTKRFPSFKAEAYYSDDDFVKQAEKIQNAVDKLIEISVSFNRIALPEDGLGTGLAQLDKRAPKTFAFLQHQMGRLNEKLKNEK